MGPPGTPPKPLNSLWDAKVEAHSTQMAKWGQMGPNGAKVEAHSTQMAPPKFTKH